MTDWKEYGTWTLSLLSWTAFSRMYEDGQDCEHVLLVFEHGRSTYYITDEDIQRVLEGIAEQANQNPLFIPNKLAALRAQMALDRQNLEELSGRLESTHSSLDLAELFKEYWQTFRDTIFGMGIDLYFDDVLLKKLAAYLQDTLNTPEGSPEFNEYYSKITSALELTTTQQEEIDFLKVLLSTPLDFTAHLQKYNYLPVWFDNNPWNEADLKKRAIQYASHTEIKQRLNQLEQEISTRQSESEAVLAKLLPNQEVRRLIKQIQEFAYLRQEGEIQISFHTFKGLPLKAKIAQALSIPLADLYYLTDSEIVTNLQSRDPELNQILTERKNYCFLSMQRGEYTIYTGERAHQEAANLEVQVNSKQSSSNEALTLKGTVGSKGYAKGKVRVIRGLEDISSMQGGEILVVSGTSVEYLSAMQLSAGIISEIGGITSHAAVIARELNKPCLTRVANATKLLKTGEFIELDADLGEIRKLGGK